MEKILAEPDSEYYYKAIIIKNRRLQAPSDDI